MTNELMHFEVVVEKGFLGEINKSIQLIIAYKNERNLLSIFKSIGLDVKIYDEMPPRREPNRTYSYEDAKKFPEIIDRSFIEQPGHCTIFGVGAYITCSDGRASITVCPSVFDIETAHIAKAQHVEKQIEKFSFNYLKA